MQPCKYFMTKLFVSIMCNELYVMFLEYPYWCTNKIHSIKHDKLKGFNAVSDTYLNCVATVKYIRPKIH